MIIQSRPSWLSVGIDYGCTVLAWWGWGYLLWRGLWQVWTLVQVARETGVPGQALCALWVYAGIGGANAFLLLLWSRYNAWRFGARTARKAPPALAPEQLASSFQISLALQQQLHQARVMTMHHNRQGRLIGLQCHPRVPANRASRKPYGSRRPHLRCAQAIRGPSKA